MVRFINWALVRRHPHSYRDKEVLSGYAVISLVTSQLSVTEFEAVFWTHVIRFVTYC